MDIIEVRDISKKYKDLQAVQHLSFSVKKGEIFGLLGPNGAGKTTTIKILTAQIRPDEGEVTVLGFNPVTQPEKVKERIGVVFEDQNFYPRLTVEQNLDFFAGLFGRGKEAVTKALEAVNLDHRRKSEAGKLSRGLKQRLLIARALLPDPEIVFLDEPTVGLDPHVARDIRKIFMNLRELGKTIFLTTHYMEEADEMCNRVAIINKGTIAQLDTPENLKERLGSSTLVITVSEEGDKEEEVKTFSSDSREGAEMLEKLLHENRKFKITTRKVSLEDVFIHFTGSQLEGDKTAEGNDSGKKGRD